MKTKNNIIIILIILFFIGVYALIKVFNSGNDFKDNFHEFETNSELMIELDEGVYELFELSTKSNTKSKKNYLISSKGENPKIVKIGIGTSGSGVKRRTSITYTIFDKDYRSIGKFEINKKQFVKIVAKIEDNIIDRLAYRKKGQSKSFFGVMKYSFLLWLSIVGVLISGLLLLIKRR